MKLLYIFKLNYIIIYIHINKNKKLIEKILNKLF